ncbi:hybrid sensor histidine kinase/response regulator [Clostridium sp. D33t1_170424_F3]|uniref:hybrid sensor histidine kinase/response regulator n=1 Tax=Clostridium sp. D33t1_170424_F3 TaxID=2787099 RepID=UPI0018A9702B|nr:hybrid sensor histidine kinase/response regulator [Clostridium sp. D33t1_170424_F3]
MNRAKRKIFPLFLLFAVVVTLLSAGYWIYQKSVREVIHATTVSFMEQIAEHDRQNMLNQMDSKWKDLMTITNRVNAAREYSLAEAFTDMKLNVVSGTFQRLYLVTNQGSVYSHTGLRTALNDMTWKDDYLTADGSFASIYRESSREHWGEYMICGANLAEPVQCGEERVAGIVGLVPISSIEAQMRLESFDQMGMTVIIQSNGEIVTSSTVYEADSSNNYLRFLANAGLQKGYTQAEIQSAIQQGERQLFRFSVDGKGFYTLIEPLNDKYHSGWSLVVQLSDKITTDQVRRLLVQSLVFFVLIGIVCLVTVAFIYRQMNEVKTLRIVEQTKTKFLANMSHEIRTPLNGISGLCYLMQESLDDRAKMSEYLQKALVTTTFLQDIINDVLDMSKIESGQLELICRDLDLNAFLSEINKLLETQANDKGIAFTMEYQDLKQNWVIGDEIRLKQILMNILGNAIKFTPANGSVKLTATQTLDNETANTIFIIRDTGCGMSQEFLERIWQPFEQENRTIYKNGTGLGTTISKNLVEKMGGTISADSKPEQGTAFTITIPLLIAKSPGPAKEQASRKTTVDVKGRHILVVEDNELNRLIITTVLGAQGCLLTEAVNGKEAVDIFEASPEHAFDLILMDVQMPVMDGYEAARRIRQSGHPDARTVIIFAVTANAFQEDLDRALAAGMNDALTKPLDIAKLLDKIACLEMERE